MTGDPADIGRAPVHVLVLHVEDEFRRRVGSREVTARRVDDALGFPGGARGVEDVEHVLGIHRFRLADQRRVLHEPVVPVIAPFLHVHRHDLAGSLHDDDARNRRGRRLERFVGDLFELDDLAPSVSAVGRDQHLAL